MKQPAAPRRRKAATAPVPAPQHDPVHHPAHYTGGEVECIEAIESQLTPEEYRGFLRGQVVKYLWRLTGKGDPRENAAKADWYLQRLRLELDVDVAMAEED